MRSYPRNSPEAAARITALVVISDGHVCRSEVETLQQLNLEQELGLAPGAFKQVVHTLCEDLLMGAHRGSMVGNIDKTTLALLLAEVDEASLQAKVLQLASAAAEADTHLADAEALLMNTARQQWCSGNAAYLARVESQPLQLA